MKNGVSYKYKNVNLKISIYLNQTSTLQFRSMLPLYRNQSTDLQSISESEHQTRSSVNEDS